MGTIREAPEGWLKGAKKVPQKPTSPAEGHHPFIDLQKTIDGCDQWHR